MIICYACGHEILEHNWKCRHIVSDILGQRECKCNIGEQTCEARYWARKMMRERDVFYGELEKAEEEIKRLGIQAGEQFERAQENDKNAAYWAGMWATENKECNKLHEQAQEQTIEMWTIEEFVKYKKQLEIAVNMLQYFTQGWSDNVMANAQYALAEIKKIEEEGG
jgi:hypothetical protein